MQNAARLQIAIHGAVQGVGFRPFVFRLATRLGLAGWVSNSPQGVEIEAEGPKATLDDFLIQLERDRPGRALIQSVECCVAEPVGLAKFGIRESNSSGTPTALILPDIATCGECLRDIFEPANRRYLYPFTNCTQCGPRFTIIDRLPYDRINTSMASFRMCGACRAEYSDPGDRRFHAQPNACPDCGPRVELWDREGRVLATDQMAIEQAAHLVTTGLTLALKGLGGFHLIAAAQDETAVMRLRIRKHREEKPFAVMLPSLAAARQICDVNALEEQLLTSAEAPIVLASHRAHSGIAASVAPRNPHLGVMLPYTPLHHILMSRLNQPLVATSGNRSDEPIAIGEHAAVRQLEDIADAFLVHNRPIRRHADDSIVRVLLGRPQILRRARGYAPLPISLRRAVPGAIAVGGHMKNAVALTSGSDVFVSQHIGDLQTREAASAFRKVIADLQELLAIRPDHVACDAHPDYASTAHAASLAGRDAIPIHRVQHHHAHVLSCMAENGLDGPVLGVAWDGTGLGPDGTIWGGEFLLATFDGFERAAHLRTFSLPGGEAAMRKPVHSALGLLYEVFGTCAFGGSEPRLLRQMLEKKIQTPRTSSAGRLFDAVASIVGLRDRMSFEGQAAMDLEFATAGTVTDDLYGFTLAPGTPAIVDWELMIRELLEDIERHVEIGTIAAKFHNTLAEMIVSVAVLVKQRQVVLTGGCFQNRYLMERAVRRLRQEGFLPYWHQQIPPNDGGIALGQVVARLRAGD